MHYDAFAFSRNVTMPTMAGKFGKINPNRDELTQIDVEEIRRVYNCNSEPEKPGIFWPVISI
jgi:hypothetical protein